VAASFIVSGSPSMAPATTTANGACTPSSADFERAGRRRSDDAGSVARWATGISAGKVGGQVTDVVGRTNVTPARNPPCAARRVLLLGSERLKKRLGASGPHTSVW
jgi:hypothetical protein